MPCHTPALFSRPSVAIKIRYLSLALQEAPSMFRAPHAAPKCHQRGLLDFTSAAGCCKNITAPQAAANRQKKRLLPNTVGSLPANANGTFFIFFVILIALFPVGFLFIHGQ
jgi:hypothetical protein